MESTGERSAGAYLALRISLSIQRGNVTSRLGSLPSGSGLVGLDHL